MLDIIMFGRLLDVGEGQGSILVGDVFDLIESRDGVANVLRVGHRLFALARKREHSVGQVAFGCQFPILLMRLPGRLHRELLLVSLASVRTRATSICRENAKGAPFVS